MKRSRFYIPFLLFPLCLVLGFFALRTYFEFTDPRNQKPFSHTVWMQGDAKERINMSSDLVRNHLKKGMTCKEVIDLLGEPSYVATGKGEEERHYPACCQGTTALEYDFGAHDFVAEGVTVIVLLNNNSSVESYYIGSY